MTVMLRHSRTRLLGRGAVGGLLGLLLIFAGGAKAIAADDDDDTLEQRMIKGILSGLGVQVGRPDIDYRERSPLVIPPTRDLPPPEGASAVNSPAWPNDPDQRKTAANPEKFVNGSDRARSIENPVLSPTELRKGTVPGAGRVTKPTDTRDPGRNLSPGELGYTGGLFDSLVGGFKPEQEPFAGEPPRTSLTQPPTGYQTPSPNYPYGVGPAKNNSTLSSPMVKDRAVGSGQ